MKLAYPIVLKDALHNCAKRNIRGTEDATYGRGILIGAVSAVMAINGANWAEAFALVKEHLPADLAEECLPNGWGN
jgi:hypothetical protein